MNQVTIAGRGGNTVVEYDEEPTKVKIEKIASLKPAFKPIDVGKVSPRVEGAGLRRAHEVQGRRHAHLGDSSSSSLLLSSRELVIHKSMSL